MTRLAALASAPAIQRESVRAVRPSSWFNGRDRALTASGEARRAHSSRSATLRADSRLESDP